MRKTKLIDELTRAPVEFKGRRMDRIAMPPATFVETSELESPSALCHEREVYQFSADFCARFVRMPHEPEAVRLPRHRVLLASVADGVYGEVRDEVRKLLPLLWNIDDRDLRLAIEAVIENVIYMTEVDS